jgi:hypothetical protein
MGGDSEGTTSQTVESAAYDKTRQNQAVARFASTALATEVKPTFRLSGGSR